MRILNMPDVNTGGESSTPPSTESATSEQVVNNDSASTTDESSTDQPIGLEQIIKDGFKAASAEKETETEEVPQEEGEEKETPEEETVEEVIEDKGPIPYERFAEVNKAKTEAERTLTEQKDLVAAYNSITEFCSSNGIVPEDFSYWLNVAAAVKNDPSGALELLKPRLNELQAFSGETLSPELTSAVENGEMSLEWAKKLAAAENKQKFIQHQSKQTQAQIQQQQQQRFMNEVQTSFDSWAHSKLANDPDFAPKKSEDKPDGRFELVLHKIGAEWQKAGIKTPSDLTAFAEKCYNSIKGTVSSFSPQKRNSTIVRSNQSRSSSVGEPKTMEEAIVRGFNKAGVAIR